MQYSIGSSGRAVSKSKGRGGNAVSAGLFAAVAAGVGLGTPPAEAANVAWSTAPTSNLFSGVNWTSGNVAGDAAVTPVSGDTLFFGASTTTTLTNDNTDLTYAGLTFNTSAALYTIGGNAFTLGAGGIFNNSGAPQTISNNIALSVAGTIALPTVATGNNAAATVTLSGLISGSATSVLRKADIGTLILTGANNTFAGGVTIGDSNFTQSPAPVVRAAASGALGTGLVTILGNASQARVELVGDSTISNNIALSAKTNAGVQGVQSVSGNNTLAGTITFGTGGGNYTIQSDSGSTFTLSGATAVTGGTTTGARSLVFQGNGNFNVTGAVVNGSAAVTLGKTGSGTLTLGGTNTYSGVTNVSAGTLSVASIANNTGTGTTINLGSGAGTGTLLYTGPGEVSAKTIFQSAGAAANGGTLDMSGIGTLQLTAPTLGAAVGQAHTLTLRGSTSGTGQVDGVISEPNNTTQKTSVLKQGSGKWVLTAANTYTGTTTVAGGTLQVKYAGPGVAAAATPLLTAASGTDLNAGTIIFDYSGATSPTAELRTALAAGYTDATTPGVLDTGTIRSTAASLTKGIGYVDNGAGLVTAKVTLFGDADLDGGVSINDFNALAGNFGQSGKFWSDGDFDYDGGVSINDFNLLAGAFGQSLPAGSDVWSGLLAFAAANNDLAAFEAVTGVPEPTALGLLATAAAVGLRRRPR